METLMRLFQKKNSSLGRNIEDACLQMSRKHPVRMRPKREEGIDRERIAGRIRLRRTLSSVTTQVLLPSENDAAPTARAVGVLGPVPLPVRVRGCRAPVQRPATRPPLRHRGTREAPAARRSLLPAGEPPLCPTYFIGRFLPLV
ncbi:hypothetical protein CEXT_605671 [Caerostris extrusa]|uniref:Uncharacterized protein n=1 Tax=Caerostris extrusa TaxID=172846 RepID=A0AAV4Y566_CAEEX|nr:hypothetical protein CEXT_605671 [Caerostris extrusa]